MSWPEAPRSAQQDPAWPEPPRTDDSWPEPPRRSRSEPGRPEAAGPQSWPDLPPQGATGPSWPAPPARDAAGPSRPEPSQQSATGPSWPNVPPAGSAGPSSWPDTPPPNAGPSSWPDSPSQSGPSSWPDSPPQGGSSTRPDVQFPGGGPSSWPEASPQSAPIAWPETPQGGGPSPLPPNGPSSWPDSPPQGGPSSWPDATPQNGRPARPDAPLPGGPSSWSEGPQQGSAGQTAWPDAPSRGGSGFGPPSEDRPVPDPVPAWEQPPPPAGSWSNLSSPAPWPPAERDKAGAPEQATAMYQVDDLPQGAHAPPRQQHPSEERTMTYAQHSENLLNDRAVPSTPNMDSSHTSTTPPSEDTGAPRPGSNLSRDPSDPDRPFVTAGQISGSRTPPPERQQELWNTVFGDNYEGMGDQDGLEEESQGKPIWIYALGGSVAIALVAALLWAFLVGPLAGDDPAASNTAAEQPTTAQKPSATRSSTTIGPLPKYSGKAAPVLGRVPDAAAGISLPRLGGTWRLDTRTTVKATYNYDTRQFVPITQDKSAQLMSGPLPQKLASYYEKDNLEPVIKQVVLDARKRFFPTGNKVRKIAQQPIKVGDSTGRLIAYSLTSDTEKATIVTMAVNTGGNLPAIVYMSIPTESKQLLPDVRTVMNQLRIGAQG
ncbi:hypothetical protein ACIBQ1_32655 [Nonomuraea sp. NPDC050153]|uniref:hypothetical protein n=1 Tax=Nonomuraea sp. NPDC050153 TaxID=3364359 RepID=UPI0037881F58